MSFFCSPCSRISHPVAHLTASPACRAWWVLLSLLCWTTVTLHLMVGQLLLCGQLLTQNFKNRCLVLSLLLHIVRVSQVTTEINFFCTQYKYHCWELHLKVSFWRLASSRALDWRAILYPHAGYPGIQGKRQFETKTNIIEENKDALFL